MISPDGSTCVYECTYDPNSSDKICKKSDGSVCLNYEPVASQNYCKACDSGMISPDGSTCVNECTYDSSASDKICKKSDGSVCLNYEPVASQTYCKACDSGMISPDGKTCVMCTLDNDGACKYNSNANICSNFEPNDQGVCKICTGDTISIDGKKCVNKCTKDSDGACKYSGSLCVNYEPGSTGSSCITCDVGYVSTDGKKCVKCKIDSGVCKKTQLTACTDFKPILSGTDYECVKDEEEEEETKEEEVSEETEGDEEENEGNKEGDENEYEEEDDYNNHDIKCPNGLNKIDGKCPTCFERYRGCEEEECDNNECKKCIKLFQKPDKTCDHNKQLPLPTFDLLGFGRFNYDQKSKIVTFVLYLRIKIGMMFNARITFTLMAVTSSGTRFLLPQVNGTGVQDSIALGSYSQNSYFSDYLAKFNCKAENLDFDEKKSKLQIDNLWLIETNGDDTLTEIEVPNSLEGKDISQYTGNDIEEEYGKKILYIFIQKADYNERRLSDSSRCSISKNVATLNIDGTIKRENLIDGRNFTLNTTDGKEANCTLNKDKVTYDANLKCTVEDPGKSFYLKEDNFKSTDNNIEDGEVYMLFTANTKTPLCQYYSSDDSDSRGSSSSSGGLSGGAIAGIVIASIAIVAVIGTIIFFVYKGAALFGGVNAGAAAYTEPGTSSISNMNVPKLKK